MEGGGSGEDRCQDKVEEKVREGQRQDKSLRSKVQDSRIKTGRAESKGERDLCPPWD